MGVTNWLFRIYGWLVPPINHLVPSSIEKSSVNVDTGGRTKYVLSLTDTAPVSVVDFAM